MPPSFAPAHKPERPDLKPDAQQDTPMRENLCQQAAGVILATVGQNPFEAQRLVNDHLDDHPAFDGGCNDPAFRAARSAVAQTITAQK